MLLWRKILSATFILLMSVAQDPLFSFFFPKTNHVQADAWTAAVALRSFPSSFVAVSSALRERLHLPGAVMKSCAL